MHSQPHFLRIAAIFYFIFIFLWRKPSLRGSCSAVQCFEEFEDGVKGASWCGNEEETINRKVLTRFSLDSHFFCRNMQKQASCGQHQCTGCNAPRLFAVDDLCTRSPPIIDHQTNANIQSSNTARGIFLIRCFSLGGDKRAFPSEHKSQTCYPNYFHLNFYPWGRALSFIKPPSDHPTHPPTHPYPWFSPKLI